jgi:large subunit ribosomal protein L24
MKIKKGDNVLIILGKYRGKKGKILKVIPKKGKVLLEGINLVKKSQKPKRSGEKGQIVELPAPLDASNVKLVCSKCGKPTRIGYKIIEKKKYRFCKKCKQEI